MLIHVILISITIIVVSISILWAILVHKEMHIWIMSYLQQQIYLFFYNNSSLKERHIIVAVCDHFDFGSAGKYMQGEEDILDIWEREYPPLSDRHCDSNGVNLKHTWFFPYHYHRCNYLERIVDLCSQGYGEVEMHLHHDHTPPFPDTSETLRNKIKECVDSYSKYGVFCLPDGTKTFAFIHGDWALDNSRGGKHCGVNDEIKILSEEGCYADFTFPSLHESQPRKINSIYYVEDDVTKPKSYDSGVDVMVNGKVSGDLMLIQGPLGLRFKKKFGIPFFPSIEAAELEGNNLPKIERMSTWLKANVHVIGNNEWIFIKLHTHGAMKKNFEHNIGKLADNFFSELENKYNNPKDGYLHYVSAREMYNIIKAAEAGMTGDPGRYRNFCIPRYCYLP